MEGELHEKCAVTGSYRNDQANMSSLDNYMMLRGLQHRGTLSTGIVTESEPGTISYYRDSGLVTEVFTDEILANLHGKISTGHNRWATNGRNSGHYGPTVDKALGAAVGHNGNLPDTAKLEAMLSQRQIKKGNKNDSEMMAYQIFQEIYAGNSMTEAIEKSYELFIGGFSCTAVHDGNLIAFRDQYGIRPLSFAQLNENEYLIASETCVLNKMDCVVDDVPPGHIIVINEDGHRLIRVAEEVTPRLDIFEFVYFARADSELYGQNVGMVRRNFGRQLFEEQPFDGDDDEYLIVPVPKTSVHAAQGYGAASGIEVIDGIVKDDYVQRTFTTENLAKQAEQLDIKHNMIGDFVKGRKLIFIDDSIVKMRTIERITQQAWHHGAKEVNILSASPPIRFPSHYGVNTTDQTELPASYLTIDAMRRRIEATSLGFLSLSGLVKATGVSAEMFDLSSFNGDYPIPIGDYAQSRIRNPISMEFAD